jgi:hypothetical protein
LDASRAKTRRRSCAMIIGGCGYVPKTRRVGEQVPLKGELFPRPVICPRQESGSDLPRGRQESGARARFPVSACSGGPTTTRSILFAAGRARFVRKVDRKYDIATYLASSRTIAINHPRARALNLGWTASAAVSFINPR